MTSPDDSRHEARRLKAVHDLHLLDTLPEERFDRLTRTAQRLFQTPVALITLVDETRIWIKSKQGLQATEIPRSDSFCNQAILHDDLFVIENALEDPRFSTSSCVVRQPFFRFYAGLPLRGPNGLAVGTLCVLDHVPRTFSTADRHAFQDLGILAANEINIVALNRTVVDLRNLERMKNDFISTVSHELRTPLTSIHASLGLMAGGACGEMPQRAQPLLEIANQSCKRLVRLINDILDIEKMEAGATALMMTAQPLLPLVEQAIKATDAYADRHRVRFELQHDQVDCHVNADADRLMQVIVNLLSNAVKFSPEGGIVTVRLERHSAMLRLSVIDRGPGIEENFRDRIFQKFSQADSSDTRRKGGTGLGLHISRSIVEKHGGHIDFVSEAGKGATFYFTLPTLERAAHVPTPGAAA